MIRNFHCCISGEKSPAYATIRTDMLHRNDNYVAVIVMCKEARHEQHSIVLGHVYFCAHGRPGDSGNKLELID